MDGKKVIHCVEVCVTDCHLIENWRMFADSLEIPDVAQNTLDRQFNTGTISAYDLFMIILQSWISINGSEATLDRLVTILKNDRFVNCADIIQQIQLEQQPDQFFQNQVFEQANDSIERQIQQRPNHPQAHQQDYMKRQIQQRTDQFRPTQLEQEATNNIPVTPTKSTPLTNDWLSLLEMEECLGSGCFGIALQARNKSLETELTAVKFVFPDYPEDVEEKLKERDVRSREFKNMEKLKLHDNVVPCFNYSIRLWKETDITVHLQTGKIQYDKETRSKIRGLVADNNEIEVICIQMKLCGPDLRTWLNDDKKFEKLDMFKQVIEAKYKHNFDRDQLKTIWKAEICQGIITGLNYLHAQNVIHRDLKPENIYFDYSPYEIVEPYKLPIKIGDFGLSRTVPDNKSLTLTKERGTTMYRASEVDEGRYGKRADRFSLGLILFEVFNLIPYLQLRAKFQNLIFKPKDVLGSKLGLIPNLDKVILGLTREDKNDRIAADENIDLEVCVPREEDDQSLLSDLLC